MIWSVLNLFAATPAPEPLAEEASCTTRFEFEGQPSCVEIHYENAKTEVTNRCEHALLLDRSVQHEFSLVGVSETVEVSDLSAFTLGMNGELYVAMAKPIEVCD